MNLPDEVISSIPQWKQRYGKIFILEPDQRIAKLDKFKESFVVRALTAGEYEMLLEAEEKGDTLGIIEYLMLGCLLHPFASKGELPEEIINFLLMNIKKQSGFDNIEILTKTAIRERNKYDPNAPGVLLRTYRAILLSSGVSLKDSFSMTFEDMIQYLVAIENVTKKQIIALPGFDDKGRKKPVPRRQ